MSVKRRWLSALLLIFLSSVRALLAGEAVYETSFEKMPGGALKTRTDGDAAWRASGGASITGKYAHTGKQSLHLAGGDKNTLELALKGDLRKARGISFRAERWTRRAPFEFQVFAKVGSDWREVAKLDQVIQVGARFLSDIALKLPDAEISGLRFVCTSPADGGILIDDFKLLADEPEKVTTIPRIITDPIDKLLFSEDLFVAGTNKTHTFRIPALITAPNGDLIACCDARRNSSADLIHVRDIDIVIRRSKDHGKTWGPMEAVIDYGDETVSKPASDPSFILDRETGEIFCLYNFMDQVKSPKEFRLHVQSSKDNGKTWSEPRDITDDITKPEWKKDFKFITSGRGIQRRDGTLMHTLVNLKRGLHLFYSKDHGKTWDFIDTPIRPADESKVVELADESLMVNVRINGRGFRGVHRSDDNGKSWDFEIDATQVDPGCNGSIVRYTARKDGYAKDRLLLCHANSASGRKNLVVKISYDEGKTWSTGKVIDPGPAAYSSLTICQDGTIGVLYEPGYRSIRFARFTLEDLTDGEDKLTIPYKMTNTGPGKES